MLRHLSAAARASAARFAILLVLVVAMACGRDQGPVVTPVATVRVSPGERALVVGQSFTIGAQTFDAAGRQIRGRDIAWSTSDDQIATVSAAGVVEAMRIGTAVITATSEQQSAAARVVISAAPPAPVASVELSTTAIALVVGQTLPVVATPKDAEGAPLADRAVAWSSADAAIATVSAAGVVEAKGAGRTTITALSEGMGAQAIVNVTAPPRAAVDRVELDATLLALFEGATRQLVATPKDAAGNALEGRGVQWTSSDPGTAHVGFGGLVTAIRPGNATITVKVEGKTASATVGVSSDIASDLVYDAWSGDAGVPPGLFRVDPRAPEAVPMGITPAGRSASDPSPSPDGGKVAFVVGSGQSAMIYVIDRDGTSHVRLTSGYWDDQPAWSPDGSRIAFRRRMTGAGTDIYVMNADGSGLVNLTGDVAGANQSSPAWSPRMPDGGYRIAYSESIRGLGQLYTMKADGSDKVQLTNSTTVYDDEPAWSPDGTAIVFHRISGSGFGDLMIVGAAGGVPRGLTGGFLAGPQWAPAWSPDGRLIAFASKHHVYGTENSLYQIFTVRPDGSGLAQRTFDATDKQHPSWIRR